MSLLQSLGRRKNSKSSPKIGSRVPHGSGNVSSLTKSKTSPPSTNAAISTATRHEQEQQDVHGQIDIGRADEIVKDSRVQQQLSSLTLSSQSNEWGADGNQLEPSPKISVQLPSPEQRTRPSLSLEQNKPESPATGVVAVPRKISLSKSADSLNGSPTRLFKDDGLSLFSPVRPSSPLLSVLREAVDSLSSIEDFEKLALIGSGFFAEVYKVRNQLLVLYKVSKQLTPSSH